MELNKAKELVLNEMIKHKLILPNLDISKSKWRFEFDNAKLRLGCCKLDYPIKGINTISLSRVLTELNEESIILNVIKHEVAHALSPKHEKHGKLWREKAIEIGCDGRRCYDISKVVTPKAKYIFQCPNCDKKGFGNRYRESSCGECSNGVYNPKYKFIVKKVDDEEKEFKKN